jgi:dienelactone hydrolase
MSQEMLKGFRQYPFPHGDISHDVYVVGDGPPIIVLHELPGFGPPLVDFARRLSDRGFQLHLPHLFGTLGKSESRENYRKLCVSLEFANLAAGVTAPIADWLRALAREISQKKLGCSVGAIGMCLTGAFVIPLILEPCIKAPVTSQPAIPLSIPYYLTGLGGTDQAKQLNVCDKDLYAAADRLRENKGKLLAFRFEEDRLCPPARFARLEDVFQEQFEAHEYGGCSLIRKIFRPRHSVLTGEYGKTSDGSDPGNEAFERVCEFMREGLTNKLG